MPVQRLTIAGKRFVVMPESEYRALKSKPDRNGHKQRLTAQDRGDIAEAKRRSSEKSIPWEQLKSELKR